MSYPIADMSCIAKTYAARLRQAGITTTGQLLARCCTPIARKELAVASGISEHDLCKWADRADLMRIKGIAVHYGELLGSVGVGSNEELRQTSAEQLHPALAQSNAACQRVRTVPNRGQVEAWIAQANAITPKMQ